MFPTSRDETFTKKHVLFPIFEQLIYARGELFERIRLFHARNIDPLEDGRNHVTAGQTFTCGVSGTKILRKKENLADNFE